MAMTKRVETEGVAFTIPVIGPKDYVVKGPSGWPEVFRRKAVDAKLVAFVKLHLPTADVAELVDVFIAKRELLEKPEPTTWWTVVGFLGRTLNLHPNAIPAECGIAFWAQVVIGMLGRGAN